MKPAKGMRGKLDKLFSELVRERANWTCEACGKQYKQEDRMGLHCSHFFSRRYTATRWHPDNAASHCFGCHQRLGGNPIEFSQWIQEHIGQQAVDELARLRNMLPRWRDPQYRDLLDHLRIELDMMRAKRTNGEAGRIEFMAWGGNAELVA
jgi:hypothetical protein